MPSLPIVFGDRNTWATKLVDFLRVSHNENGTLKPSAVDVATGVVNVKRTAIGDGVTDDTSALQDSFDSIVATGGIIYFPPGSYLINLNRLIYSSVKPIAIIGAGLASKIIWVPATDSPSQNKGMLNISGTDSADASHCLGVIIRDLYFDFGSDRSATYDSNKRGLNIYNSDDVHIFNCFFEGCRGEMVGIGNFGSATTPGNRARIINNTFYDFAQDGVNPNNFDSIVAANRFLTGDTPVEIGRNRAIVVDNIIEDMNSLLKISSVVGFQVKNNVFKDCAKTDSGSAQGVIQVAGGGANEPSTDGVIAENVITNSATYANQIGINLIRGTSTSDNTRIEVIGNTVNGVRQGIFATSLLDGIIDKNILVGDGSGGGIVLASGGQCLRNSVNGNNIRNYAARTVDPTTNGPIQDQTGDSGQNVVGFNTQENKLVLGATGRIDFADGDTTPSVQRPAGIYYVANTAPTVITQFDDGAIGREITLVFDDANTTINDGGNFVLNGNFTSTGGDSLKLVGQSAVLWIEVSRSVN